MKQIQPILCPTCHPGFNISNCVWKMSSTPCKHWMNLQAVISLNGTNEKPAYFQCEKCGMTVQKDVN